MKDVTLPVGREPTTEQKAANLMGHAVVGAVVAQLSGKDAGAGALGAASGELAAEVIRQTVFDGRKVADLSESEKQPLSALSTLAAGLASGLASGNTADGTSGAQAGRNAVENNYLSVVEADRKKQLELKRDYLKQELTDAEKQELADIDLLDKARDAAIRKACPPGSKGSAACGALVGLAEVALEKYGANATYSLLYKDLYPEDAANVSAILKGLDAGSITRDAAITAIAKANNEDWNKVASQYDRAMQLHGIVSTLAGYYSVNNVSKSSEATNTATSMADRIKGNVAESQKARESSNFGQYSKAEGGVQETLGIWPPNRGAYGPVENVTLPTGELIDRYGSTKGTYTSPAGVPFENRALPSSSANAPYNIYEILKPIDDVSKSKILPWFGQKGQGTQYELPKPVQWYIDNGYLGKKK